MLAPCARLALVASIKGLRADVRRGQRALIMMVHVCSAMQANIRCALPADMGICVLFQQIFCSNKIIINNLDVRRQLQGQPLASPAEAGPTPWLEAQHVKTALPIPIQLSVALTSQPACAIWDILGQMACRAPPASLGVTSPCQDLATAPIAAEALIP